MIFLYRPIIKSRRGPLPQESMLHRIETDSGPSPGSVNLRAMDKRSPPASPEPPGKKGAAHAAAAHVDAPCALPREERYALGRSLRRRMARSAHGKISVGRRDPVDILEASNRGRLTHLVPIRYGRMLHSPFAFLRGAAAVMAHDLGHGAQSGVFTQLCGDCHLNNFGGYASPERELLFGINDFDETLPGPFEWDLKRLATSFVVAAREQGIPERACGDIARAVAATYRLRMREYAEAPVLERWYAAIDVPTLVRAAKSAETRARLQRMIDDAKRQQNAASPQKLTRQRDGDPAFIDRPPLIYHPPDTEGFHGELHHFWHHYVETLPEERRKLLDHFRLVDVAIKVVGVGSVGTRCAIALLVADDGHPLVLQFKEARASVYESFAGRSRFANHGLRVVVGQRLMQSASDIFLGFSRVERLRADFYVRQLRDMKVALDFECMSAEGFAEYAEACAWALARAHARAGDPALIAGYLGRGEAFERAISKHARAYADRTEADHAALAKAVKAGRIRAEIEPRP
jgi:uncharacterized protein (DUF2252 family)